MISCEKCEAKGYTNLFGGPPERNQVLRWCSLCKGETKVSEKDHERYIKGILLFNSRIGMQFTLADAAEACNMSEFEYARLEAGYTVGKVTPRVAEQMLEMEKQTQNARNPKCK